MPTHSTAENQISHSEKFDMSLAQNRFGLSPSPYEPRTRFRLPSVASPLPVAFLAGDALQRVVRHRASRLFTHRFQIIFLKLLIRISVSSFPRPGRHRRRPVPAAWRQRVPQSRAEAQFFAHSLFNLLNTSATKSFGSSENGSRSLWRNDTNA